jgi:hypothetical protein
VFVHADLAAFSMLVTHRAAKFLDFTILLKAASQPTGILTTPLASADGVGFAECLPSRRSAFSAELLTVRTTTGIWQPFVAANVAIECDGRNSIAIPAIAIFAINEAAINLGEKQSLCMT